MKKNGFTIVEVLVVIVIIAALAGLIAGRFNDKNKQGEDPKAYEYIVDPIYDNAKSQRRIAEELKRQNDLLERRLDLLEGTNPKSTAPTPR